MRDYEGHSPHHRPQDLELDLIHRWERVRGCHIPVDRRKWEQDVEEEVLTSWKVLLDAQGSVAFGLCWRPSCCLICPWNVETLSTALVVLYQQLEDVCLG